MKSQIPRINYPRKLLFRRFGIVALILLLIWLMSLRRVYFEDGMRISLKSRGEEGAVTFIVEGPDGKPEPGVNVSVENTSGGGGSAQTDEYGVAVLPESETEIVGVRINGTFCEFLKFPLVDRLFRPDCASGLTVKVKLMQHP